MPEPKPRPKLPIGWGVALLLVVLGWGAAFVLRGGKVEVNGWTPGIDAGQEIAAELDRPMIVMFTADWCGPCQDLKRDVLNQPEIDAALQARFVPVIEDMTTADRGDPRMSQYRLEGYPTLIALTPDGQEIAHLAGNQTAEAFMAWLDRARQ